MSYFRRIWQSVISMSLIKQLWLAIILMMTLAFVANVLVHVISSKNYLQKQLEIKNIDNAVSLALSISQMEKDPVAIELMLSAQFDNGHYRSIRLVDPNGNILVSREDRDEENTVPTWFTTLIKLRSQPGVAQIQNGWSQYGTLLIESATSFAYLDLWQGAIVSMYWNAAIAFLSGLIGTLILKVIVRPLRDMVAMTEAISAKNFITIAEPKTQDFRQLARAMNRLSTKIKVMFNDQAQLLEQMRLEANHDATTGLMNRKYFISRLATQVSNEENFSEGLLVITHIANLAEVNRILGSAETDAMLKKMGHALAQICGSNSYLMAGRLNGADFAVFSNQPVDTANWTANIRQALMAASGNIANQVLGFDLQVQANIVSKNDQFHGLQSLIAGLNEKASSAEAEILRMINQPNVEHYADRDEKTWYDMLTKALDERRLSLAHYPVLKMDKQTVHLESPVRLQLEKDGNWVSAAEFITWAIQLNLINRIDDLVVEHAIELLNRGSDPIGLNVSSRAMCNPAYAQKILALLAQFPEIATKLWLEVPEDAVFNHLDEFKNFCETLKSCGCKLGVEHVGAQIARLGELHDLGLDYIKVDASIIRGIDKNTGNQAFVKGLCLIAQAIGLIAIAEGVSTKAEADTLPGLGIEGMTGPGVRAL